ncbi:hypothetical protein PsYK624_013510 [Phanerochaete sordida]|uniref:Uncharacterized protein n=1 Tax=Phanerochaete sordida TaxID=48140 RepID=A0A9P3L921_9APHY|nr:hypothetical protein PsYK624_013510 [Phanerochaete sordida]
MTSVFSSATVSLFVAATGSPRANPIMSQANGSPRLARQGVPSSTTALQGVSDRIGALDCPVAAIRRGQPWRRSHTNVALHRRRVVCAKLKVAAMGSLGGVTRAQS